MLRMEWDPSFSVNNAEIDGQHKEWIGIFNKMHAGLIKGNENDLQAIIRESLRAMQDYARYHFEFEEALMRKIGYPDLVRHMRMHKDFDALIYRYNRDLNDGEIILGTELIKIIKDWLLEHIRVEDKKYAPYIAEYENRLKGAG